MKLFSSSPAPLTKAEAFAKFVTELNAAISSATNAGISSRQIGDVLEQQATASRQNEVLMGRSPRADEVNVELRRVLGHH
jgi:hypothetical protein